jgi:hypothetical protein
MGILELDKPWAKVNFTFQYPQVQGKKDTHTTRSNLVVADWSTSYEKEF